MMPASDAAQRTMNAIREQVKKISVDNLISQAADDRKTELSLTLSQLSEMFGKIAKEDINVLARQPIAFRVFRADLTRLRYECRFEESRGEWFFTISWKDAISI